MVVAVRSPAVIDSHQVGDQHKGVCQHAGEEPGDCLRVALHLCHRDPVLQCICVDEVGQHVAEPE